MVEMKPQHNWPTWRAVDFGYHYPACLWLQEAPSGQVRVVAELAGRKRFDWTTEEFADAILAKDASLGLVEEPCVTFCDPAGNGVNAQTGESEVEVFKVKGLAPVSEQSRSVTAACVSQTPWPSRRSRCSSRGTVPGLPKPSGPWDRTAIIPMSTTSAPSTAMSWTRCATTSSIGRASGARL